MAHATSKSIIGTTTTITAQPIPIVNVSATITTIINRLSKKIAVLAAGLLLSMQIFAVPTDIQIRSVNFTGGVLELHNFGAATEALDGWRFCSHDEDQVRRYSGSTGLNGQSLASNESLFIHFNNDAIAANEINISTIGGQFALDLDNGPYAIQIYFAPVAFGGPLPTVADHVQWSIDGIDNTSADERSDEAELTGTWVDQSLWVSTTAQQDGIVLADQPPAVEHGPDDYIELVLPPEPTNIPLPAWALAGLALLVLGIRQKLKRS